MTLSDQPGWRPDPQKPGSLRWWNGLGWSDAWRSAGEAGDRERTALQTATQGSTISPEQVARTGRDRRTQRGAPSGAPMRANGLAGLAPVLGFIGLLAGLFGAISAIGLVVSLVALVRSRRIAGRRSGLGAALIGLFLSVVGLIRWLPALLALFPQLQSVLNS